MPKLVTRKPKSQSTKSDDHPALKPYIFHGLPIDPQSTGEIVTDCPFCGRQDKFSINADSGKWRCFVCGLDGGVWKFIEELYKLSDEATTSYAELASARSLEFVDTLSTWGVCKSILTDNWMIPGYSLGNDGKLRLQQLYQYTKVGDRMALLPTPGQKHTLFGLQLFDRNKPSIHICEGPWDAFKYWEVLRFTKQDDEGILSATASNDQCMLKDINVIATPSCTVFNDAWAQWTKDKAVAVIYDNDYPEKHPKTGEPTTPAGFGGMQRTAGIVKSEAEHVFYMHWGDNGYDPALPDSYDVSDILTKDKHEGLAFILNHLELAPDEWSKPGGAADSGLKPKPCDNFNKLITSWRKAMKWTEGLEHGLTVMLASVASTKSIGDQLWIKIIGPPSCGKTTIAEAVGVNKQYTVSKSTIRGFHSGFVSKDAQGKIKDTSLIQHVSGKTLIVKDGDTLLQSPNKSQILSEGRDLYDGTSRSHYRNETGKDHEGVRMTWLLCGTSSLRELDSSELGERFLDCVIMDKIEPNLENDILWRVANRAADDVGVEANGDMRSQYTPAMCECMELTGGYVDWLRNNASVVLPTIEFSDEAKIACIHISRWVAFMRAKKEERELAARLLSQHIRLAKCLAFVLNRPAVDTVVIKRVRQVGMDTARGPSLEIAKAIYFNGHPMEFKALQLQVSMNEVDLRKQLMFLKKIGVLRPSEIKRKKVWCLTEELLELSKKLLPIGVKK